MTKVILSKRHGFGKRMVDRLTNTKQFRFTGKVTNGVYLEVEFLVLKIFGYKKETKFYHINRFKVFEVC